MNIQNISKVTIILTKIAQPSSTPSLVTATNPSFSSDRKRFASVKRSAFGTARKLTLAGRSQSLRIKRNTEPLRPHTSDGRSGSVQGSTQISTVPFYLPSKIKTSRSSSNSATPLFNTSLLELKQPVEIDIPVEPEEVSSALEFHRLKSLQEKPDFNSQGIRSHFNSVMLGTRF